MRGSQPPQDGLLGPAQRGRSGRPVAAPRATGGRHLPGFMALGGGGGTATVGGRGAGGGAGGTCEWALALRAVEAASCR